MPQHHRVPDTALTRRSVLGTLAATGATVLMPGGRAAAATSRQVQLTLPRPTGPYRLGLTNLHLIDPSRRDPWVPSHPVRELMISLWYPARDVEDHLVAPWLEPAAWQQYQRDNALPPDLLLVPPTHGHLDAPIDRSRTSRPVILFSPGSGGDRNGNSYIVEELVSHGYVVVTIDHTHDSGEVQFPDGHVEIRTIPPDTLEINTEATSVRAADTRFVLDTLATIRTGRDPDADTHPLPAGLGASLDLDRVGMFGHSMGGATAAWAMFDDGRIHAGINMDGACYGPVVSVGLDRPFMLMSSQEHNRDNDASWARLWSNLRGWRLDLQLLQSGHESYDDVQALLPQASNALGWPPEQVEQLIGTIEPARAIAAVRAYVRAFFDLHLYHRDDHLLDGPSPRFPKMRFIP